MVARARVMLKASDYRGAVLSARHALQMHPADPEACRVMAEIGEVLESREAIFWRVKVSTMPRATTADRLALAAVALRFDEHALADQALLSVPPAARRTAQFHTLAGMLAVGAKNLHSAEAHFSSVCQLEPTNELARLNLASVRLCSRDPRAVEEARRTLRELSARPSCPVVVLRALFAAALKANQMEEAEKIADRLVANPQASWQDLLQRLQLLRVRHRDRFEASLAQLQAKAAKRPEAVAQTVAWMVASGMGGAALSWAERLPPALLACQPIPLALAEARATALDWDGLRKLVERAEWPAKEELRQAWLARACRELGDPNGARRAWKSAGTSVSARPMDLILLARLAKRWGWNAEVEELLWGLVGTPQYQKWALCQLFTVLQERGDTWGLRRVVERVLELDPNDKVARNKLALYTLLLHGDTASAAHHAAEIHESSPSNTAFASTWAFALHAQGKTAEGLRVLEALPEKDRRDPSIAAYRGILLAATGNAAAATECLDLAKAAALLPEERELVEAARRSLSRDVSGKRDEKF